MDNVLSRSRLLELVNRLPRSVDAIQWATEFRNVIAPLVPEADRISININLVAVVTSLPRTVERTGTIHVKVVGVDSPPMVRFDFQRDVGTSRLVRAFSHLGLPVDEYWPPIGFDYETEGGYVGSILLWRLKSRAPMSPNAAEPFLRLAPFLRYAMSSACVRFQASHQQYLQSRQVLNRLTSLDLTNRQREILVCRANGYSIRQTAQTLCISEATVRRHLRALNSNIEPAFGSSVLPGVSRSRRGPVTVP